MVTEIDHRSNNGTRFLIRVLDEGTQRQRLSLSAEYWVENEGYRRMWCILGRDETAEIARALKDGIPPVVDDIYDDEGTQKVHRRKRKG